MLSSLEGEGGLYFHLLRRGSSFDYQYPNRVEGPLCGAPNNKGSGMNLDYPVGHAREFLGHHHFMIHVNINPFSPEEVEVTQEDEEDTGRVDVVFLKVEGSHREGNGYSPQVDNVFIRRFLLPPFCRPDQMETVFDNDGILKISIPRIHPDLEDNEDEGPRLSPEGTALCAGLHSIHNHSHHMTIFCPSTLAHIPPSWTKGVDITEDGFVVRMSAPDFTEHEIRVRLIEHFLIIEGEHDTKDEDFMLMSTESMEYISHFFRRKYLLPLNALTDKVKVEMDNTGILQVSLPRDPHKKICEKIHDAA